MPFVPLVFSPRRARRHPRLAAAGALFVALFGIELGSGVTRDFQEEWFFPIRAAFAASPAPLAVGDRDGDGLDDARESELARAFAPIVLLDPEDPVLPASVSWVLSRTNLDGTRSFDAETRRGSERPDDRVTYVDVHPRAGGGIHVEYWFYYPYNDGPLFFDHESDWEHLTVRLDDEGRPLGAYLARHEDSAPGPYFDWSRLRREGRRPVVLSARGSHATYADLHDVAWFDTASTCDDLSTCPRRAWRTWEGGGLERLDLLRGDAPALRAFRYPGRWGASALLPGRSAPRGPIFQAGHCAGGTPSCRRDAPATAPY